MLQNGFMGTEEPLSQRCISHEGGIQESRSLCCMLLNKPGLIH